MNYKMRLLIGIPLVTVIVGWVLTLAIALMVGAYDFAGMWAVGTMMVLSAIIIVVGGSVMIILAIRSLVVWMVDGVKTDQGNKRAEQLRRSSMKGLKK
ncbi:MAG: hypothetical protein ACRC5T_04370 [Cetobacterium sp.]